MKIINAADYLNDVIIQLLKSMTMGGQPDMDEKMPAYDKFCGHS